MLSANPVVARFIAPRRNRIFGASGGTFPLAALIAGVLSLGCAAGPTADLPDMWLPTVTVVDDGCNAQALVEAAWWKADIEKGGDDDDWFLRPMSPMVETFPAWHCPERDGGLACWPLAIGGSAESPPTMMAILEADRRGDVITGDIDVLSTPLSGLACTSTFEVEAQRLDWSSSDVPPTQPSCDDLAATVSAAGGPPRTAWVINNSNTTVHIDGIDPGGGLVPIMDVSPYNVAMINSYVGHSLRAQRQDDGTCLSMLQVSDDTLTRWIVEGE